MGLFSSKTKTTVGTSTSRVIEDKNVPDALATGYAKAIKQDGAQSSGFMMDELSNSLALRMERMFAYGRDKYIFGNPKSTLKTSAAGKDATQAAISALENTPVTLDYYHFGAYNNLHFAWKTLVESMEYDSQTNEIKGMSTVQGAPVYLVDMQVVVTDATLDELANGSMDQWGKPANAGYTPARYASIGTSTPYAVDPTAGNDYVRIDFCWQTAGTKVVEGVTVSTTINHTGSTKLPVTGLDPLLDYHQARYTVNGKAKYFTYLAGSGQIPSIDAVFDTAYATGGSFYPIVYFRYQKESVQLHPDSVEYKDSSKLCKIMGMDLDAIAMGIDQNPDIDAVEQGMMLLAASANSKNMLEQHYLYDFFSDIENGGKQIAGATALSKALMGINLTLGNLTQETSVIIQDKRFKSALSFKGIARVRVAGSIGQVGDYAGGMDSTNRVKEIAVIGGGTKPISTSEKMHYYRRQVTESIYEEIQVYGLRTTYWIFEGYTTAAEGDSENLLIPLDRDITKTYSLPDREKLYARSLQFVFNSRVETKVKWYQTGVFRTLLTIAAVIITVVTELPAWQAMAAAFVAGEIAMSAVFIAFLTQVLKQIAIKFAFKVFVKEAGTHLAFIAAVVALVAGGYQAITKNSVALLPSANSLLMAATGLNTGITTELKREFEEIQDDFSDFKAYTKAQDNKMEQAKALLDTGLHVDPLIVLGESPHDFYQRTVHSGNIGVVSIEAVSSYVDMALQLPKLSQTVGDF